MSLFLLIIITGSSQVSLFEINDAIQIISDQMPDNANIIFGYVVDKSFKDSDVIDESFMVNQNCQC